MKDFVVENYDLISISKDDPVEECSTFLIAEDHLDESIRKINGLFISHFATPASVLLLEGEESLSLTSLLTLQFKQFHIDTQHIKQVLGWDLKDYEWLIEASGAAQQIALLIDQREYPASDSIDWEKEMLDLFYANIQEKNLETELKAHAKAKIINVEKRIKLLAKSIIDFEEKNIRPLQTRLKYIDQMCEIEVDPLKKMEYMCESINLLMNLYKETSMRTSLILRATDDHDLLFPQRTNAMIVTLDKVRATLALNSRIFLIAGIRHLQESTNLDSAKSSLYSLESLREYVQSNKKIAILRPKNMNKNIT